MFTPYYTCFSFEEIEGLDYDEEQDLIADLEESFMFDVLTGQGHSANGIGVDIEHTESALKIAGRVLHKWRTRKQRFNVTFETITAESAEQGECEEIGFLGKGLTLRDALDLIGDYPESMENEANDSNHANARWITFHNVNDGTREFYESGITENRALHFPEKLSDLARERICKLVKVLS